MSLNLGKWGTAVAAGATALATVVTDGVLDAPDGVTIVIALLGAILTGVLGKNAFDTDPNKPKE